MCNHFDCKYRAGKNDDVGCNYMLITGHSRIKGLPPDRRDPELCDKYEPGPREIPQMFSIFGDAEKYWERVKSAEWSK